MTRRYVVEGGQRKIVYRYHLPDQIPANIISGFLIINKHVENDDMIPTYAFLDQSLVHAAIK